MHSNIHPELFICISDIHTCIFYQINTHVISTHVLKVYTYAIVKIHTHILTIPGKIHRQEIHSNSTRPRQWSARAMGVTGRFGDMTSRQVMSCDIRASHGPFRGRDIKLAGGCVQDEAFVVFHRFHISSDESRIFIEI